MNYAPKQSVAGNKGFSGNLSILPHINLEVD